MSGKMTENPRFKSSRRSKNIIKCKITDKEGGEKCDLNYGVFNIYMRKKVETIWLPSGFAAPVILG